MVQPKAKRTPDKGKLFSATLSEDVVLVPTAAGTYPLEAFHFVYFDPKSGTYKTLTAPRTTVTVTAPPAAAQPAGRAAFRQQSRRLRRRAPAAPPAAPDDAQRPAARPAAGPGFRRAGPGRPRSSGPLLARALRLASSSGCASPGEGRAKPIRSARAARPTGGWLPSFPDWARRPRSPLLLAWQRDAALLWGIGHAAPAADAFGDPNWSRLWSEADRALYGPAAGLPADWAARAQAALAAKPAPAFLRRSLFWRGNLLPWLALALAVWAGSAAARAAEPAAAYRRAEFADAEQGWRAAVAQDPADWTARYNLSLALAQQDRWDEAAAQATAAFVQQPANASVRWQFALACDKAGYAPEPLAGFLTPGPGQDLAQLASAPDWQRGGVLAAVLAALALVCLLASGYDLISRAVGPAGGRPRPRRWPWLLAASRRESAGAPTARPLTSAPPWSGAPAHCARFPRRPTRRKRRRRSAPAASGSWTGLFSAGCVSPSTTASRAGCARMRSSGSGGSNYSSAALRISRQIGAISYGSGRSSSGQISSSRDATV